MERSYGSLLERVAYAISEGNNPERWKPEANDAIREVAAWLREQGDTQLFSAGLELDRQTYPREKV